MAVKVKYEARKLRIILSQIVIFKFNETAYQQTVVVEYIFRVFAVFVQYRG